MVKYSENGSEWVKEHLNENMRTLRNHKGCCRFDYETKNSSQGVYKIIQSPIEIAGGINARIEVQDMPPPMDFT